MSLRYTSNKRRLQKNLKGETDILFVNILWFLLPRGILSQLAPLSFFNFQNLLLSYQLHYIVFNTVGYIISGLCRLAIKPDHIHLSDVSRWWQDGNDLWCWTACSCVVWRKSFAQMGLKWETINILTYDYICFMRQEVGVVGCHWIHYWLVATGYITLEVKVIVMKRNYKWELSVCLVTHWSQTSGLILIWNKYLSVSSRYMILLQLCARRI